MAVSPLGDKVVTGAGDETLRYSNISLSSFISLLSMYFYRFWNVFP